jgi:hypothetical protein
MYIQFTYCVYTINIHNIFHVQTWYMHCIYNWYTMYICSIYKVYSKYIQCSIYNEYSWYITVISSPVWYMHGIYLVYTWYISVTWPQSCCVSCVWTHMEVTVLMSLPGAQLVTSTGLLQWGPAGQSGPSQLPWRCGSHHWWHCDTHHQVTRSWPDANI